MTIEDGEDGCFGVTRIAKLYVRIQRGKTPGFSELKRMVEAFGFSLDRIAGSHHIYSHPDTDKNLNLQPEGKLAKPYQVRQVLDMIEEYGLRMDDQ